MTTVRNARLNVLSGVHLSSVPDPQAIQRSVSDAQCGTSDPAPVVAVPHPGREMAVAVLQGQHSGPDIHVPSAWQMPGKAVRSCPTDSEVQDRWMNQGYRSPPSETISLEISALHEGGPQKGRMRGTPFGCICKGMKDIDARTTAPELVTIALAKLTPKISEFCPQFLWRPSEFVVCDSSWVNLSSVPNPMQPYFYHECLHPGSQKNSKTPVFKPKQFLLFVVVPESQWQDSFNTSAAQRPILHDIALMSDERASLNTCSLFLRTSSNNSEANEIDTNAQATSRKRSHQRSTSVSSATTHSPPSKKTIGTIGTPGHDRVKEALQVGGATNVDIGCVLQTKLESVVFYPIPTIHLEEILDDTDKHAFGLDQEHSFNGQLRFDTSSDSLLGVGGFKTAHIAHLLLQPTAPTGLGSLPRHMIVLKRPYFVGESTTNRVYKRYMLAQELPILFREANVLYWAKSLLKMTYEFIDHAIRHTTDLSMLDWITDIPRLRFVEAGLTLVYASTSKGASTSSTGSVSGAYLLEEKIDAKFTKFIHNVQYSSCLKPDNDGFHIMQFLVFTQHIQYIKTDGLAYISDYQGSTTLLTDPQILTHPSVGGGTDIFSEGNVEIGVERLSRSTSAIVTAHGPDLG
ncbi:hypothetical protein F5141DRAFT_1214280 [Pisolithus sp. B1]|nr:hypothetical protein F5141DRAFT_1214280 [Pisolithus sp. B1]